MDDTLPPPLVAIIGAGRAGSALARSLALAGWPVGLVTRDPSGLGRAEASGARLLGTENPGDAVGSASVVVLAVRDREIAALAERLAAAPEAGPWSGRVVLHLSGSQPASLLAPLAAAGASAGSLHPLVSLSSEPGGAPAPIPAGTPFFAEGDPAALAVAGRIARAAGGSFDVLTPELKPLYHAIATLAGNLVATLLAAGGHVLRDSGIAHAEDRLLPLAEASVRSVAVHHGLAGLTGPLSRGDAETLAVNVAALRGQSVALRRAHAAVSLLALELLARAGHEPQHRAEMQALLESVLRDTTP